MTNLRLHLLALVLLLLTLALCTYRMETPVCTIGDDARTGEACR